MHIPGTGRLKAIANAAVDVAGNVADAVEDEAVAVFESAGDLVEDVRTEVHAVKVHMDEAIATSLEVAIEHLHIPEPVLSVLRPMQAFADIESCGGVHSNEKITQAYAGFDQGFQDYLGEPAVANWTTFGKFASHQAGEAINQLEAILAMDPVKLAKIVAQGPEKLKELLGDYALPLFRDAQAQAAKHPIATAALPGVLTAYYLVKDLVVLRNGLVETNRAIYANFGPPFQTFLDAEKAGQDGVAAVKAKVADGTISDPGGLLTEALTCYQQAQRLTGDPAREAEREALIARGNLLIGMHEQYYVVQPKFTGEFSRLSGLVSGELEIEDANGKYKLLSAGQGNWADFCTRMGLVECEGPGGANGDPANGVLSLTDANGKVHYFRQAPADQLPGTIIDYFTARGSGEAAANNMAGQV